MSVLRRLQLNLGREWSRVRVRLTGGAAVRAYLAAHEVRKLQIGCGPNLRDGWLNTDVDGKGSLRLDATRPFPLPDAAFDCVFSEHVIEHIAHADAQRMLKECHRVLKPGGRVRIATPDLRAILGLYVEDPTPEQQHYIDQMARTFRRQIPHADRVCVINGVMSGFGHRFIYDAAALGALLENAGFTGIATAAPGESADPHLRGLEMHGRAIGDEAANRYETLVLEGTRPG